MLGADHPHTLTSRNNLALAYQDGGGPGGRAIPLFERTLADCERVLGADHPDTLGSRNNLALAYQDAGAWAGRSRCSSGPWPTASGCWAPTTRTRSARGTTSRAPTGRRAGWSRRSRCTSGPWPTASGCWAPTTRRRSARGTTSRSPTRTAGLLEQAIPLFERTLADSERVLGADHPDTLGSRNNLAGAYRAAGRLEQAIPLFERTLADSERVLGADHPDTLTSRNNLERARIEGNSD